MIPYAKLSAIVGYRGSSDNRGRGSSGLSGLDIIDQLLLCRSVSTTSYDRSLKDLLGPMLTSGIAPG
jgi:hypothetical protein